MSFLVLKNNYVSCLNETWCTCMSTLYLINIPFNLKQQSKVNLNLYNHV